MNESRGISVTAAGVFLLLSIISAEQQPGSPARSKLTSKFSHLLNACTRFLSRVPNGSAPIPVELGKDHFRKPVGELATDSTLHRLTKSTFANYLAYKRFKPEAILTQKRASEYSALDLFYKRRQVVLKDYENGQQVVSWINGKGKRVTKKASTEDPGFIAFLAVEYARDNVSRLLLATHEQKLFLEVLNELEKRLDEFNPFSVFEWLLTAKIRLESNGSSFEEAMSELMAALNLGRTIAHDGSQRILLFDESRLVESDQLPPSFDFAIQNDIDGQVAALVEVKKPAKYQSPSDLAGVLSSTVEKLRKLPREHHWWKDTHEALTPLKDWSVPSLLVIIVDWNFENRKEHLGGNVHRERLGSGVTRVVESHADGSTKDLDVQSLLTQTETYLDKNPNNQELDAIYLMTPDGFSVGTFLNQASFEYSIRDEKNREFVWAADRKWFFVPGQLPILINGDGLSFFRRTEIPED